MYLYMPLFGSPLLWFLVAILLLLDVHGKYGLPFIFCIHLIYASFSLQLYISSHAIFFILGCSGWNVYHWISYVPLVVIN
jgi:hypothetical protein